MGIKETKEALAGFLEALIVIIKSAKDGLQLGDLMEVYKGLWENPEVKQKLLDAFEGISNVPDEIRDVDIVEGSELAVLLIGYLPEILDALKKEEV